MKKLIVPFVASMLFAAGVLTGSYVNAPAAHASIYEAIPALTLGQSDITDPQALKFVSEFVRPCAEKMRALKAESDAAMVLWYAEISAKIPNDASPIQDGRDAEGVSRLVGTDVNTFMAQVSAFKAQLDASGVPQVISKPCVRAFSAN